MKFHLNQAEGLNIFTGYGDDHVLINHQRYAETSLLVMPEAIITDWTVTGGFTALDVHHFEAMLAQCPEVALLGTGNRLRFPHPSLTAPLINAGIGLEVMDSKAACRTYNILASEGRRVVIALLLERCVTDSAPANT